MDDAQVYLAQDWYRSVTDCPKGPKFVERSFNTNQTNPFYWDWVSTWDYIFSHINITVSDDAILP